MTLTRCACASFTAIQLRNKTRIDDALDVYRRGRRVLQDELLRIWKETGKSSAGKK